MRTDIKSTPTIMIADCDEDNRCLRLAGLRETPIIAISSNKPISHSRLALAAGCAAHMEKPIEFDRLDLLIDQFLPGGRWQLASALVH